MGVVNFRPGEAALLRGGDHGLGQWVLGARLDRERQQLGFIAGDAV